MITAKIHTPYQSLRGGGGGGGGGVCNVTDYDIRQAQPPFRLVKGSSITRRRQVLSTPQCQHRMAGVRVSRDSRPTYNGTGRYRSSIQRVLKDLNANEESAKRYTMYYERLRTLQDAYVFFMLLESRPQVEQLGGRYFLYLASNCRADKHFSSRVPRGSYEQHPEGIRTYVSSRLHI